MSASEFVAIALGSNLDPQRNIREAARLLRRRWEHIRFSRVYATSPVGHADQADFLNAVAVFHTTETPEEIMDSLREIEAALGKNIQFRWGPRTIDLDLLLYGEQIIERDDIVVPHPRMHERRFVLVPLLDLVSPKAKHPLVDKTWEALLEAAPRQGRMQYAPTVLL
jgi:2-amino-4-hydroxy-6-hydroxymethyldihydropteridine diphosphokinase